MAMFFKLIRGLIRKQENRIRMSTNERNRFVNKYKFPAICVIGGTFTCYTLFKYQQKQHVHAAEMNSSTKLMKLTTLERRFVQFASSEYNGQIYMTPQDFLDWAIGAAPKHMTRRVLSDKDLDTIKKSTLKLVNGSRQLFTSLGAEGIISYTEYLFLVSILIKPQSGFQIAFKMFDTDGNNKVDKSEFLALETVFSNAWKSKRGISTNEEHKPFEPDFVDDRHGLQTKRTVDTTLIVHFFGAKGKDMLNLEDFRRFMMFLQREVLELEFNEFSKGLTTISEADFAKILLRYTYLHKDEYDNYLRKILSRLEDSKGITFEEFYGFCQFLNNLDDFSIAIRMFNLVDQAVSEDEFIRAVRVCTGANLSNHTVHTVFSIFDSDGDGLLSYQEFIAIMKNRLHRGFKSFNKSKGWKAFKYCVKYDLKPP